MTINMILTQFISLSSLNPSLLLFCLFVLFCFSLVLFIHCMGFPGGSDDKESACNAGEPGSSPRSGRSLEKGMEIHSSILSWNIPWTEEPGGLHTVLGVTKS